MIGNRPPNDVTFYLAPSRVDELELMKRPPLQAPGPDTIPPGEPLGSADIILSFKGDPADELRRGLVCRCYAGDCCAVTARATRLPAADVRHHIIDAPNLSHFKTVSTLTKWPTEIDGPNDERRRRNATLVSAVWNIADPGEGPRDGLVIVAGATGSRKTTYAREIARQYLSKLMPISAAKGERPHVVTCEDPIESWFAFSPQQASEAGFEYTPRQKGIDVRDLYDAVNDALRQKPTLLYVNEVRRETDWRALFHFAATGHFAITTTHAGSLVETFGRILAAAEADTPAKRSEVASRLVAIIHLKAFEDEPVPALWVPTPSGRTAMTQGGLGSLLPGSETDSYVGRAYFASALLRSDAVIRDALKSDLYGE